jgi:hypothetical protein
MEKFDNQTCTPILENAIEENMLLYTSLKYLDSNYNIGSYDLTCSCLSASLHSIEVCSDLAMFPKNVKTFIGISASIGNRPDSI